MAALMFNNSTIFPSPPENPGGTTVKWVKFIFAAMLFLVGNVPQAMALSSCFYDSKVANAIGGLLTFIPIIVFM